MFLTVIFSPFFHPLISDPFSVAQKMLVNFLHFLIESDMSHVCCLGLVFGVFFLYEKNSVFLSCLEAVLPLLLCGVLWPASKCSSEKCIWFLQWHFFNASAISVYCLTGYISQALQKLLSFLQCWGCDCLRNAIVLPCRFVKIQQLKNFVITFTCRFIFFF